MTVEESRALLRRELPVRMAELESIDKGNLSLPEKLYAFVLEQVDSGTFASVSEFVAAAIRSPKKAAGMTLSGRWNHVRRDREDGAAFQESDELRNTGSVD